MAMNYDETTGSGADAKGIPWVLFLPLLSESLHLDRHLSPFHGETVIEWWHNRLRVSGAERIYVLTHRERQTRTLKALRMDGVEILPAAHSSQTHALAAFAEWSRSPHIVLVTLASALGPVEAWPEMVACHLSGPASVTYGTGLPDGVTPWVISADFLRLLCEQCRPLPSPHPGLTYLKLAATMGHDPRHSLYASMQNARMMDFRTRFGLMDADIPLSISLFREEDLSLAREAVHGDMKGMAPLQRYKQALIRRRVALRNTGATDGPQQGRKIRILYVSNASAHSGAEESLCQLLGRIDSSRYEVFALVGMKGYFSDELSRKGAQVITFSDGLADPTINNLLLVGDVIRRVRPDLIHSNSVDGLPVLWNAVSSRIPFIQHVRNGVMTPYREPVEAASAVIAVSQYLKDRVLRFAVAADRVHVVYDEADPAHFSRSRVNRAVLRQKLGIGCDTPVIAMIARFAPNKRHDLMLRSFSRVKRQIPDACLLLKGDVYKEDPHYDAVKRSMNSHEYATSIVHLDFVQDIRDIHAIADVLVLCSDREGLGRCIVEAMAMEVPVVVTDSGGSHEIIRNGKTGIVVPGGDSDALADAVVSLLRNPALRQQMGAAARTFVCDHLTAEQSAASVMKIYEQVLLRHRNPGSEAPRATLAV